MTLRWKETTIVMDSRIIKTDYNKSIKTAI